MYCNECGTKIPENSKFCPSCGAKVLKGDKPIDPVDSNEEKESTKSKKVTNLWDKFVEIYDSSGDERKKFEDLSSNEVWELIQRLSSNGFENFIQTNKELLNKQPYKVIETLKNVFTWCASGGYWFWMAENLLKNDHLKKPKDIALNHFIKEWQEITGEKYSEYTKDLPEELTQGMSTFSEYELKNVLDSSETVKDLPNEFVESLRTSLIILVLWSYLAGVAEKKYRK